MDRYSSNDESMYKQRCISHYHIDIWRTDRYYCCCLKNVTFFVKPAWPVCTFHLATTATCHSSWKKTTDTITKRAPNSCWRYCTVYAASLLLLLLLFWMLWCVVDEWWRVDFQLLHWIWPVCYVEWRGEGGVGGGAQIRAKTSCVFVFSRKFSPIIVFYTKMWQITK